METIDFHGRTTVEVKQVLQEIEQDDTKKVYKLITGVGNHTKQKPIMDYYCSSTWKNPIKKVVYDYIVYEKKEGAKMEEFPSYIIWRR